MSKESQAREIVASDRLAGLVDRGYAINVDLKKFTSEDKEIKKEISQELKGEFEESLSVRVMGGGDASALVTRAETYSVSVLGCIEVDLIRDATERGLYGEAVSVVDGFQFPPAQREKAIEVLNAAGIDFAMKTSISIDSKKYREMNVMPPSGEEASDAREVLKRVVNRESSFRVKYERK